MRHGSIRAGRATIIAIATVFAAALSTPAYAASGSETFNNANINIHGGNATVFAGCINLAKERAKLKKPRPQSNLCQNFAHATGGSVELDGVSVLIDQEGSGQLTRNNTNIDISGGDADATAACVNFLQGTANAAQVNKCSNHADARGGNVTLKNVDIVVIQTG
jgi:hypothetical protein